MIIFFNGHALILVKSMSNRQSNFTESTHFPPISRNNSKSYQQRGFRKGSNSSETKPLSLNTSTDPAKLADYIYANVIGNRKHVYTPYGHRQIIYCDHIASGRSIEFIENFLKAKVLPFYGNTHTTTSICSRQTTRFRHEARKIIFKAVNASEEDVVIFKGSGTTGAVHKLINCLGLNEISGPPIVVYVSNQEHHSNLLPWREIPNSKVIIIPDNEDGTINHRALQEELEQKCKEDQQNGEKSRLIGCFAAASNITGLLNDDLTITALLHQYGALSFWDYATAAPHTYINVNPQVSGDMNGLCKKDAAYFSCHKFLGGVQTPGILITKKHLLSNSVPDGVGGGTVSFVTKDSHGYLKDIEEREEGGTPAIVESIRAGLTIQLKQAVGCDYIGHREHELMKLAKLKLASVENFILLGNAFTEEGNHHNLPILSFLIKTPSSRSYRQGCAYLHHNFVSVLLSDLFGIQARGGCACAGPYAQTLLGLSPNLSKRYLTLLYEDEMSDLGHRSNDRSLQLFDLLKPGFTRLNLSWFAPDEEANFVVDALIFISNHGWKLLPQYVLNSKTGEWQHHTKHVSNNTISTGVATTCCFLYRTP